MAQRLLLFPSNKHKMCEMQKHKIMIILVLNAGIVTNPKIPIGKSKYKCKYCNYAPKFQLVKVSTGEGIATKSKILVGKGKYKSRYFKLK